MSETLDRSGLSLTRKEILHDYQFALESREASLAGRKEVFIGKAKFGIFGDGKEVPQLAMARYFQNGDWRSGYYRDQTFMMAIGELTIQQFFAQLYAHTDVEAEPASAGRMMNSHFATRYINDKGEWVAQTNNKNSSADISPTSGQMPRLLGLAYASGLYRANDALRDLEKFSANGNEVAFGTIGNAATSEGHFWETMNAAGVLQVPLVLSVWDDDYGISVPKGFHTVKKSISEALAGFQRTQDKKGVEIFTVRAWDYSSLLRIYKKAVKLSRKDHIPCLIHVTEATQPQGHSTSGSHERYKSRERLEWEKTHDCIFKMREWMIEENIAAVKELEEIEKHAKQVVKEAKEQAWKAFTTEIINDRRQAITLIGKLQDSTGNSSVQAVLEGLGKELNPLKSDITGAVRKALRLTKNNKNAAHEKLAGWLVNKKEKFREQYNTHLYDDSSGSALHKKTIPAIYHEKSEVADGRVVLNACFDLLLKKDPRIFVLGEDVGKIGDVNQGFAGLQDKYGEIRVTDTGIRETTIIGQGIGAATRGLRPIVEIQYLDYLLFAIQTLSDDLATLLYRTRGGQKAPLIIRTRGHRLEGIWHSGSPMGMILHSLRGIYILTPRNMTQAAGFYNTLMRSEDPALVIESLNGYRLKERVPGNLAEFQLALGVPELLKRGKDVTIVTYGSICRMVMEAACQLEEEGIDAEVVDVQTLIPFDRNGLIVDSLKKTNRLAIVDEDVTGGASAYILQQILERDNGYYFLDSKPLTISGKDHRPAYGSDGDYFSKPGVEDIVEGAYELVAESDPKKFKSIY